MEDGTQALSFDEILVTYDLSDTLLRVHARFAAPEVAGLRPREQRTLCGKMDGTWSIDSLRRESQF